MIQIFSSNAAGFLTDLAAWLTTPIPLTFAVLLGMVAVFKLIRGFML